MRQLTLPMTILTFIFVTTPVFAHKDRIEKPKTYKLTFQDGQTVTLDKSDTATLTTYSKDIVNGKLKLIKAEFSFRTGETLTFEGNGSKWTRIEITDSKTRISIPDQTMEKISVIHFQTIALLWDGLYEKAFKASYFYISLDIGNEKTFNVYPELHLSFSDNKFTNATVWRQISKTSRQRADF